MCEEGYDNRAEWEIGEMDVLGAELMERMGIESVSDTVGCAAEV